MEGSVGLFHPDDNGQYLSGLEAPQEEDGGEVNL